MSDQNAIGYWFPKLRDAGLPVPKTLILELSPETTHDLVCHALRGEGYPAPTGNGHLTAAVYFRDHAREFGAPCFLRSAHFSGKHSWRRTCYISDPERIGEHLCAIINEGELASLIGFPWNQWALREFLRPGPGDLAFNAFEFGGMPVRREFRYFVRDGTVLCRHPYWPADAFRRASFEQLAMLRDLEGAPPAGWRELDAIAAASGAALGGFWSIDLLSTDRGWFVTDCATGDQSWHWPGCPHVQVARA